MIHLFPEDFSYGSPFDGFTDPFRYAPHPAVQEAARIMTDMIDSDRSLSEAFSEGKMLGVLVVSDASGQTGYLAAFSGNVAGRSQLEGFVPPIYDLLDPQGHFKIREAEITAINTSISVLEDSHHLKALRQNLAYAERARDEEIGLLKARMAVSKRERDESTKITARITDKTFLMIFILFTSKNLL